MLNELRQMERGARQAGITLTSRHPDVKAARRVPTLRVRLAADGHIHSVRPVPSAASIWTLRDGQQNSVPFMQPKKPLFTVAPGAPRRAEALDRTSDDRRQALLTIMRESTWNDDAACGWVSEGFLRRLRERRAELATLDGGPAAVVPATIDRFLVACDSELGGAPERLLREIAQSLESELRESTTPDLLDVAAALLIDGKGALLFDAVVGNGASVLEPVMSDYVSVALRGGRQADAGVRTVCALTGMTDTPVSDGAFPQPNLPVVGQTFVYSRNRDTPANGRYGRTAAETMPVGVETADSLAAALQALTASERQGTTWRSIPGEVPKQQDLLIAFVDADLESPVTAVLAEDDDEDLSDAAEMLKSAAGRTTAFERRTKRVMQSVEGWMESDIRAIPRLFIAVLRKVDPANRKIVYSDTTTVHAFGAAVTSWVAGERNVPSWLTLPVLHRSERKPRQTSPPHVAPLGVVAFSRPLFVRGGTEHQEVTGMPASQALELFFDVGQTPTSSAADRLQRVIRLVLTRRATLLSQTAHALRRSFEAAKPFDRREALRTVTILGVLLHKSGRTREIYMQEAAFKLGQLLAAADVVHAGYCADVRGGALPPSLLGNQTFALAQTARPLDALGVLGRRWKPYEGWARKVSRERTRIDKLIERKGDDAQRGWAIRTALRHAREMRTLANELHATLSNERPTDEFRAELLLGYVAGLPKAEREDREDDDTSQDATTED